jgi:hypothetical protein
MTVGRPLTVLAAASPLVLGVLLLPGLLSDLLLAALTGVVPAALMALGAGSPPRRWRWLFPALGLLLAAASVTVLLLSRGATGEPGPPSVGASGLPAAAIVQIVGLWLLPLPIATLGYALTFDRSGVSRAALEALRRRFPRAD